MNNKELRFTGFTAVPSDYECPDGQLAQSLNLLNESGSLQPLFPPKVLLSLGAGSKIIFVHSISSSNNKHYIIYDESTHIIMWLNGLSDSLPVEIGTFYDEVHCNAIGNTLLIFTKSAIHYILWKESEYIPLGTKIPEINISFGLVGHPRLYSAVYESKFDVTFEESINYDQSTFSDANKRTVTDQVMARLNKFINEQSVMKGRFCFPFFIRYALRLYDGSLVGHSAPILMNPQTSPAPIVLWNRLKWGGGNTYKAATDCDIMMMACDIDYRVLPLNNLQELDNWADIITGIEIFISKPIYTYDQAGEITGLRDTNNFQSVFIGRLYNNPISRPGSLSPFASTVTEDKILGPIDIDSENLIDKYTEWTYSQIYELYFSQDRTYPSVSFRLPEFTADKSAETIQNCSTFYKLHTLSIEDIKKSLASSSRKTLNIDDDYLQSLVAREAMTDDYLSHDSLSASYAHVYNSRLNLCGVNRRLFNGFSPSVMFAHTDCILTSFIVSDDKTIRTKFSIAPDNVNIHIYIKEAGKTYVVTSTGQCGAFMSPTTDMKISACAYLFYPNTNAVLAVITSNYGGNYGGKYVVKLRPHDFLNGAFAFIDYNSARLENYDANDIPVPTPTQHPDEVNLVSASSKIYTSEVNNPFFFPVTGINTVGTGRILGICSAAKALSQGQFGQFPLYAFTDEGVWALQVSSSGGFSAIQPITRDVCHSADSITQIDSAVLFATDRGIMLISGSQTQCISDVLNSPDYFDFATLPGLCAKFPEFSQPDSLFIDYIKNCRMAYDYVNQRIILFNPAKGYSYVYSMKTKLWGIQECSLTSIINSYPDALAMAKGEEENYLVDLSHTDAETVRCLLVSRPLKFDSPDVLKTLTTTIQRGMLPRSRGDVATILYGTRDYYSWHLIGSSVGPALRSFRGSPYKAFRIVSVATMCKGNTIAGCSFDLIPRMTNRLR
ncbi:MAG: hypothetical protein HDS84_01290 [Bacteroidales bacterium]|nr:hypothetical protein [Bacteroidales bacterium]